MGPDPTVYFYTYSTICQTLAGAFGFLVAVVLYQMQAIGGGLPGKVRKLLGLYPDLRPKTSVYVDLGDWANFVEHATQHTEEHRSRTERDKPTYLQQTVANIRHDVERMALIRQWLLIALASTTVTIVLSLTLLAATPFLAGSHPGLASGLLPVTVGLALGTIGSYLWLVWAVVKL